MALLQHPDMRSAYHRALRRAILAVILVGALVIPAFAVPSDFSSERAAMVEWLRARGVRNKRVLAAMGAVPRHLFMDATYRDRAYDDAEIPLGSAQVMCSPYVVGLMVQALDPKPGARILNVGTGSGYLPAVVAEITDEVYTVDMRTDVARKARARLRSLGYTSIQSRSGRACQGWPERGPFDGILVTCAFDRLPEALIAQLAEGGRIVAPIGRGPEQTLNFMRKSRGRLHARTVVRLRVSPAVCQGK